MLRLIVHADDFGLSEPVNDGVRQAHLQGILTSTSLMPSGAGFDHAVEICRAVPSLDVGVHLTLVEERPVLAAESVPSLVDAEGRFHRHASVLAWRYAQGKVSLEEVRREFDAQIAKVIGHGIRITHLDSHQHAHMLPRILHLTVALARKHGIPYVRFPGERPRLYMVGNGVSLRRLLEMVGMNALCHLGRHAEVHRTRHFVGFGHGGRLTRDNLLKLIEHLPRSGTCELMCHPGLDDPQSRYPHWGYRWREELAALLDGKVSAALRERGVSLTSYRELSAGTWT